MASTTFETFGRAPFETYCSCVLLGVLLWCCEQAAAVLVGSFFVLCFSSGGSGLTVQWQRAAQSKHHHFRCVPMCACVPTPYVGALHAYIHHFCCATPCPAPPLPQARVWQCLGRPWSSTPLSYLTRSWPAATETRLFYDSQWTRSSVWIGNI